MMAKTNPVMHRAAAPPEDAAVAQEILYAILPFFDALHALSLAIKIAMVDVMPHIVKLTNVDMANNPIILEIPPAAIFF